MSCSGSSTDLTRFSRLRFASVRCAPKAGVRVHQPASLPTKTAAQESNFASSIPNQYLYIQHSTRYLKEHFQSQITLQRNLRLARDTLMLFSGIWIIGLPDLCSPCDIAQFKLEEQDCNCPAVQQKEPCQLLQTGYPSGHHGTSSIPT